jgi:hypothetical protein
MEEEKKQNYEIVPFQIDITSVAQEKTVSDRIPIEYKEIIGVFIVHAGGTIANFNSTLSISVNSVNIVAPDQFHAFLIEKTNALSMEDAMWPVRKEVSNSNIVIKYKDGSDITPPYSLNLYFVCRKK